MNATFSLLLAFLVQLFLPRHNAQLRLLKAQNTILRSRIPVERLVLSPAEKSELLRIGAECGHDVDGLLEVAKPATYKRWLAQMRGGRPFKAVGRPRLTQELRDVVVRIGSENLLWGYRRIVGELKKLGLHAPPPTLSLIKVQGPRTLALRPSDHGSRIVRLGPRFLERAPRLLPSIMLYNNSHVGGRYAV